MISHRTISSMLAAILLLLIVQVHSYAIEWPEPPQELLEQVDPRLVAALDILQDKPKGALVISKRTRGIETMDAQLAIAMDFLADPALDPPIHLEGYIPLLRWMSLYQIGEETGRHEDWELTAQEFRRLAGRDELLVVGLEVEPQADDRQRQGVVVAGRLDADGYREEWRQAVDDVAAIGLIGDCIEALAALHGRDDGGALRRQFRRGFGADNHDFWSGSIANQYWATAPGTTDMGVVTKLKRANERAGMRIPLFSAMVFRIMVARDRLHPPRNFDTNVAQRLLRDYPDHWRQVLADPQHVDRDERWQRVLSAIPELPGGWDIWDALRTHAWLCRRSDADRTFLMWRWLQHEPNNILLLLEVLSTTSYRMGPAVQSWGNDIEQMVFAQESASPLIDNLRVYRRIGNEGLSDAVIADIIAQYGKGPMPIPLGWWRAYIGHAVNKTPPELRLHQGLALAQAATDLAQAVDADPTDPLHLVPWLVGQSHQIYNTYRTFEKLVPSQLGYRQQALDFWQARVALHHPHALSRRAGPWVMGLHGLGGMLIRAAYDEQDLDMVLQISAPWYRDWFRFSVASLPATITYEGSWIEGMTRPWIGAIMARDFATAQQMAEHIFSYSRLVEARNLADLAALLNGDEQAAERLHETGISNRNLVNMAWFLQWARRNGSHHDILPVLSMFPVREGSSVVSISQIYWATGHFAEAYEAMRHLSHRDVPRDQIGYLANAQQVAAMAVGVEPDMEAINDLWERGSRHADGFDKRLRNSLVDGREFPLDHPQYTFFAALLAWGEGDLARALELSHFPTDDRSADISILHRWFREEGPALMAQRQAEAAARATAEAAAAAAREAAEQAEAAARSAREALAEQRRQTAVEQRAREQAARQAERAERQRQQTDRSQEHAPVDDVSDLF